jgi:hypothetical protein
VKLKSSVSFLSIKFEHVACHSSACLTQNKRSKNLQNWKESAEHFTSSFIVQQSIHQQDLMFGTKEFKDSCENIKKKPKFFEELEVDEPNPQSPHVTLWGHGSLLHVLHDSIYSTYFAERT